MSKLFLVLALALFVFVIILAFVLQITKSVQKEKPEATQPSESSPAITNSGTSQEAGPTLLLHGQTFRVRIADTFISRAKGLGGSDRLAEDEGMAFLFPMAGRYGFWMKGMTFAIDIVWIRSNKVVGLSENLEPQRGKNVFQLPIYYPPSSVDTVLEIDAGLVKHYGIAVGDDAILPSSSEPL